MTRLLAPVPADTGHGVVTVPRVGRAEGALCLVGVNAAGERVVVSREQETILVVDDASLVPRTPA